MQLKTKQIPSGAIVYVVAKNPAGPPMPIAVARFPAAALLSSGAQAFTLDDSMSMGPAGPKLSQLGQVSLEARLSMSGQANRSPGDWMAKPVIVEPGQNGLTIKLESVVQ
jgi:cytochrome c-type biogenesis protein CcmH